MFSRTYVPMCLRAYICFFLVPTCLHALNYFVPTCAHFLRTYVLQPLRNDRCPSPDVKSDEN